jgi:tetratricopeptide (TPR) repeat protein
MNEATLTLTQALDRAVAAYKAGKFIEAEQLCQQILAVRQDSFDAVYFLAFVQSRRGKKEAALASYDRAIGLRPQSAESYNDRGNTLYELKRFAEALASFDRALAVRADFAEALNNRGNTLKALKRYDEALASYDRAIAVRPDYANALNNRGVTLKELKRLDEALASYDRALAVKPDYAEALNYRGNALKELKRINEALASYDRAIAVRPDYAEALNNRAGALKELKRFDEALASYDRVLAVRPDHAETLNNRGNTLRELNRLDESLASFDRALALRPNYAQALNNRGITLERLKRFDDSLASYDRAVTLWPKYVEAINNRGVTLQAMRRFDEALASYDRASAIRPNSAEFHYNQALCRLLIGDFDRGWQEHEWRWRCNWLQSSKRTFTQPLWIGDEKISGKTILLHAEQGYGDTIQFCRYLPLVKKRGAHAILEVPKALHDLTGSIEGVTKIVSRGEPLPEFDVHCPLLSLPLAFGTRLETIPSVTPYLRASSQAVTDWNVRLGPKKRPRIGLAWSGRSSHRNDHNRSMSFRSLLPLLEIDATFVRLQKDLRSEDIAPLKDHSGIVDVVDALKDFSDTAALIANLDLIISVDTSVAHLAGALAKPIWVLLPFLPDWRWLLDRDDSPWYPTARLFRQDETRIWDSVITRVHAALSAFIKPHSRMPSSRRRRPRRS